MYFDVTVYHLNTARHFDSTARKIHPSADLSLTVTYWLIDEKLRTENIENMKSHTDQNHSSRKPQIYNSDAGFHSRSDLNQSRPDDMHDYASCHSCHISCRSSRSLCVYNSAVSQNQLSKHSLRSSAAGWGEGWWGTRGSVHVTTLWTDTWHSFMCLLYAGGRLRLIGYSIVIMWTLLPHRCIVPQKSLKVTCPLTFSQWHFSTLSNLRNNVEFSQR